MEKTRVYSVSTGWTAYVQCGDRVDARDDESAWDNYTDEAEARAEFERCRADLARRYRVERQCAGRAWRECDAYAALEAYDVEAYGTDDEAWDYVDRLEVARYGREDWDREHDA